MPHIYIFSFNNFSIHDIHEYNDFRYWHGLSIIISDIGNGHQPWELRTGFAHYSKRRRFWQDWLQRRIEDVSRSITAYLISWKLDDDLWLKIVINLNYYCRENIMERLISFSWMLTRIITWTTTRGSLSSSRLGEWLATTTSFGMGLWWPHLMHHWWTTLSSCCWSKDWDLPASCGWWDYLVPPHQLINPLYRDLRSISLSSKENLSSNLILYHCQFRKIKKDCCQIKLNK